MRKIISIVLLFVIGSYANQIIAQTNVFSIYDTIPIKSGTKKRKLFNLIDEWFEAERGTKLVAKSKKELKFKGKGYFIYYNRVKLPDVFLSPRANERTKGTIVFSIDVKIQDSIIITKFSNFIHEAAYSEYGSMSFNRLMEYDKVPPGSCMEVEEWCNAVWNDMKSKSTLECKNRASRMIPNLLIRKRSYKVKEEIVEKVEVVKEDPNEHLKLENYLIKEDKKEVEENAENDKKSKDKSKKSEDSNIDNEDGEVDSKEKNEEEQGKKDVEKPKEKETKSKKVEEKAEEKETDEEEPAPVKKSKKKEKGKKPAEEDEYDDYDDN